MQLVNFKLCFFQLSDSSYCVNGGLNPSKYQRCINHKSRRAERRIVFQKMDTYYAEKNRHQHGQTADEEWTPRHRISFKL